MSLKSMMKEYECQGGKWMKWGVCLLGAAGGGDVHVISVCGSQCV